MILYQTSAGFFVEHDGSHYRLPDTSFDSLVEKEGLHGYLSKAVATQSASADFDTTKLCAPIGNQEVWAAGVTYYRSRNARIEESKSAGGGDFYDRVYVAERPELFFKALPHKVAGPNSEVRIRRDATWSVPEPELALLVEPWRPDYRIHRWQRYELPGYRGSKSSLSAAGEGV